MKARILAGLAAVCGLAANVPDWSQAAGDANKGAQVFRQCLACHSLEPDRHLTGPSLAYIWGRKAGTAAGFYRYSNALKSADVTWYADTLDGWLKNPAAFVPNNYMWFAGIESSQTRLDLIAYLKLATSGEHASTGSAEQRGGMTNQMMGRPSLNLRDTTAKQQVNAIRYCGDAYFVTLATGDTFTFWEFNLRFKTDSSKDGPLKGKPAIVRAGMQGDRAFVVFSGPEEISTFVKRHC